MCECRLNCKEENIHIYAYMHMDLYVVNVKTQKKKNK